MSLFRDERGTRSAARLLLTGTLVQAFARLWVTRGDVSPAELAFYTAVVTALVAWAGGPRIAAYVGPQIAAATKAVGDAIAKRRASGEYEVTK